MVKTKLRGLALLANEYGPNMLMWSWMSGDSLATSASQTWCPSKRKLAGLKPNQPLLPSGPMARTGVQQRRGYDNRCDDSEEKQELKRRELAWRGSYSEPDVLGKTVILIDDGVATVSTMRAAVRALKAQHPAAGGRRCPDCRRLRLSRIACLAGTGPKFKSLVIRTRVIFRYRRGCD